MSGQAKRNMDGIKKLFKIRNYKIVELAIYIGAELYKMLNGTNIKC